LKKDERLTRKSFYCEEARFSEFLKKFEKHFIFKEIGEALQRLFIIFVPIILSR